MGIQERDVALFLHVGVVIIGFMIAAVLHASLHTLVRANTVAEMRPLAKLIHRLEPILPIVAVFILGFGAWLVHIEKDFVGWGDGWILTSLIALIVIEGLAGALLAPRSKKLVAAVAVAPEGPVSDELRNQSRDPMIWDLAHIATGGFAGVVFVMLAKPTATGSIIIVTLGAIIGVALSRLQLGAAGRRQPQPWFAAPATRGIDAAMPGTEPSSQTVVAAASSTATTTIQGLLILLGGAAILGFGIYDQYHWVPRYHVCQSGLGQLGQAVNPEAADICSTPNLLGPMAIWMIVLGAIAILAGLVVAMPSRRSRLR